MWSVTSGAGGGLVCLDQQHHQYRPVTSLVSIISNLCVLMGSEGTEGEGRGVQYCNF